MAMRQIPLTFALLCILSEQAGAQLPFSPAIESHFKWVARHAKGIVRKIEDPDFGQLTLPNMEGFSVYGRQLADPNKTLDLSCGQVKAREFGIGNSKLAVAFHSVYSEGGEWSPVAEKLAERDFYVLIPNWSGNSNTDPANCYEQKRELPRWNKQPQVYAGLLDEILQQVGYKMFDVLLGFSWGGWIATMRAAKYPESVGKVVLVAPAFLQEEEALTPSFAGYVASGKSGKELAKMGHPKRYLNKLCASVYGNGGRVALDTEVVNGSLKITKPKDMIYKTWLHGLAKDPIVKPPAWGDGHGAVVACKSNDDCIAGGKWARAVIDSKNRHWPKSFEDFSKCDSHCDQVVCATEKLTESITVPAALFWGHDDTAVHYENSEWVKKMFTNLETFYHEPGRHVIHPNYEDKIVSFIAPEVPGPREVSQSVGNVERPIGSLRRLMR